MSATISVPEQWLKNTKSRCPVCGKDKSASVFKVSRGDHEEVIVRRTCEIHGLQESVISSDARLYSLAHGNPLNQGCGCEPGSSCSAAGGRKIYLGANAVDEERRGVIEKLSTCLALIEIVDSCNLACPTCFADSPVGAAGSALREHSLEELTKNIQGVVDRKGHIEVLQFSGGEPTIHTKLFELVEWVRSNPGIDYLLINTNGVRFAKDPEFVKRMGELFRKYDNIQLYLQFDGPQPQGQIDLRGLDLRKIREQAIANCREIGLPITLAMTVSERNLPHVWDTVAYALQFEHIRGVSFQPMFLSGRTPPQGPLSRPITAADIILGLNGQSGEKISLDDFTSLPCGDPNCATIGWIFRMNGCHYSPARYGINLAELQKNLPDRINYDIEDLKRCGCENTKLGELMKSLEAKESNAFRLFVKPFMDARTWDADRIDRCCTHVIRPDGKLDSFCRYYAER